MTDQKQCLRSTEVFRATAHSGGHIEGNWVPKKFHQLVKGDLFRLWDTDKDGQRKPDRMNPETGMHDVCVALKDAAYDGVFEGDNADYSKWGVQCLSVRNI